MIGPHRPVQIADHIFEDGGAGGARRIELRGQDLAGRLDLGKAVSSRCVITILDEEADS